MREAIESLTHADSRLWQTLGALLVKPGVLTREFLSGRRASYLPPFRLYLVVSVLFFLIASALGDTGFSARAGGDKAAAPVIIVGDADEARKELDELAREAEQAARTATHPAERAIAEKTRDIASAAASGDTGGGCANLSYGGPGEAFIQPRLRAACKQIEADGGRSLGRDFMANVPRVLILFLPLIAVVMKLLYWRPRRYYVEHLLFFVHNHAFVFLLFSVVLLVAAPLPEGVGGMLTLAAFGYCTWYLFRAMRVVYGQSGRRTLAKYVVLGMTYVVSGIVLTAATLAYSVMTL